MQHAIKMYGEWWYRSIRWRWMVSFTPLLLYCRENNPQYRLIRRLGEPWSQCGCYGEEKSLLLLLGIKHQFSGCQAHISESKSDSCFYATIFVMGQGADELPSDI
jgi:hypothetical protein